MLQNKKFKSILESSSATTNNVDANYAVNMFAKIQENAPSIEGPIKYNIQSVPTFPITVGENVMVGVQAEMLDIIGLDETAALTQLKDYLNEEAVGDQLGYGRDVEFSDIAVLVKHENVEELYKGIVAEASCIDHRIKHINEVTESRNKALALGAKIVVVK